MTAPVHVMQQDVLVACIMLGLMALVGFIGNVLMLRALLLYRHLRIHFFLLLGSVAVADIVGLAMAVPKHVIYLTEAEDPVTDVWCKASTYMEVSSSFVAAYHLVVLAVLRGILLTNRGHNPPSQIVTLVVVLSVWIIAFLAAIPFLTTTGEADGLCEYLQGIDIKKDVWLVNSFSCFVPLGLILSIYLLTYLMGKRYFQDSYTYREKQLSLLVNVIVAIFVVCELPFRAVDMHLYYKETEAYKYYEETEAMGKKEDYPGTKTLESLYIARNYLLCLMVADKAVRPVIYSKLAPQLADAFDEIINCTVCARAYTHGRVQGGGGGGGGARRGEGEVAKANGHSVRLPSTSSTAPLTGESDAGSYNCPHHDKAKDEEMEIVQLDL